jgi:hypothetical protein
MAVIFSGQRGRVVRLDDAAAQANIAFLTIDPKIRYESEVSIVTRMMMSQQVNVQFLHTIGAHIYIYVFGDRIGQLGLSGLAFTGACDNQVSGAQKMYQWYKRYRASVRREPVKVTIGSEPIEGFVVNFSEDVVDPSISLVQWNVNMVTLPAKL